MSYHNITVFKPNILLYSPKKYESFRHLLDAYYVLDTIQNNFTNSVRYMCIICIL